MKHKPFDQMSDDEFKSFTIRHIVPTKTKRRAGLYLNFPFDLRSSFDEKINTAAQSTTWTAFVNNAGTLAHVMCPEADILIRLKFNVPINTLNKDRMKQVILARITPWVVV